MATKFATAYVDVDANLAPMRKSLSGVGKLGLIAGGALAAGLAVEIKSSVKAFTETEKVAKQTNAVLKSTGQVAGVSATQVGQLATAISKKSGIDDEAVQSAENLLLTFTNVRNEAGKGNKIFTRATGIIADMSVALGQDMKSSSIQVGKALNDPIKGVTALQRVGVSFTKSQKDQIKTLVDSGRTMDAQKLILRELNREFAGSAEAQAQPFDKLKVSLGNIQEAIGSGFKPAVDSVATDLTHLADKVLPHVQSAADDIGRIFAGKGNLGDKISRAFATAKVDLAPLTADIAGTLRGQKFGQKIQHAVEVIAPHIADGMASAAPHAAAAFINAFRNASPWGKIITLAFLANKFGAFAPAGRWAAGKFTSSFQTAGAPGMTKAGGRFAALLRGAGWVAAAVAAADAFVPGFHRQLQEAFSGRKTKFQETIDAYFAQLGSSAGKAFGVALAIEIGQPGPTGPGTGRGHRPARSPNHGKGGGAHRDAPVSSAPESPTPHRRHRRRRRRPPRTSGGAVAHLSSFNGDATYSRMVADTASVAQDAIASIASVGGGFRAPASSPTGGFQAPGGRRRSPHHHRIAKKAARKFMDDLAIAPSFDDVFVNQTGLKRAVIASRFSKEKARKLRRRHRGHHGTGGFLAPGNNTGGTAFHDQRQVSINVPVQQVNKIADATLISSKIARELDRLG